LGFDGEPFGLGLGAGDDLLRFAFGLAPFALVVGQQLGGLVLQLAGLVELGLDAAGSLVERFGEHAVDAEIAKPAYEDQKRDCHPGFGFKKHGRGYLLSTSATEAVTA